MKRDITAVIMAFNEKDSLESVTREIELALKRTRRSYEIIIIDDGSSDGTSELADNLASGNPDMRIIHHGVNRGLGGVYRSGFSAASGDFVTFFPADGQFPASIIWEFVSCIEDADMVLGYIPGRKSSILAKGLSQMERLLLNAIFGGLPKFQGVMMFRRNLLDKFELKSEGRGWTVLMELIIRSNKAGCKILSVPTKMRERIAGRSKVNNFRTAWDNLRQAMVLGSYIR